MTKEIKERNEAIARFMEVRIGYNGNLPLVIFDDYLLDEPLEGWAKYNYSWDWLMPVANKIIHTNNIGLNMKGLVEFWKKQSNILNALKTAEIEAVFLAVSDFCIEYNKKNN